MVQNEQLKKAITEPPKLENILNEGTKYPKMAVMITNVHLSIHRCTVVIGLPRCSVNLFC